MKKLKRSFLLNYTAIILLFYVPQYSNGELNVKLTRVWGPGLKPNLVVLPARYFFIEAVDSNNKSFTQSLEKPFAATIKGQTETSRSCRIWTNVLDRKDGTYIVRYKLYESCVTLNINIMYQDEHVADSPYNIAEPVYSDNCDCPKDQLSEMIETWQCPLPNQLVRDLEQFTNIDLTEIRNKVIAEFDRPHSVSLCHYVIRKNEIYRNCYGKYVGFKMFMDAVILSLARKTHIPDVEFFVNLGDWPLVSQSLPEKFPIFSWCGSHDTYDIVMPTYDVSQSSLENMGSVMLDMLSVQGNVADIWENRIPKVFWRGRDSNQYRLDLIDIAKDYPELFNASLTNFFFFRDQEEKYGKTEHESFFNFFDYKYQLCMDGTVAAYRMPYLIGGGSLVLKQDSKYYEHFYNELIPDTHYILVKRDLSDLVDKVKWAIQNDDEAKKIGKNGQDFANNHLLPKDILCYYSQLLYEFSKKITSNVEVLKGMEKVEQNEKSNCSCFTASVKDEL